MTSLSPSTVLKLSVGCLVLLMDAFGQTGWWQGQMNYVGWISHNTSDSTSTKLPYFRKINPILIFNMFFCYMMKSSLNFWLRQCNLVISGMSVCGSIERHVSGNTDPHVYGNTDPPVYGNTDPQCMATLHLTCVATLILAWIATLHLPCVATLIFMRVAILNIITARVKGNYTRNVKHRIGRGRDIDRGRGCTGQEQKAVAGAEQSIEYGICVDKKMGTIYSTTRIYRIKFSVHIVQNNRSSLAYIGWIPQSVEIRYIRVLLYDASLHRRHELFMSYRSSNIQPNVPPTCPELSIGKIFSSD